MDLIIGKTDANGNEIWYHEYDTENWPNQVGITNEGISIVQTDNGGFLVAGIKGYLQDEFLYKNPLVLKTDASGNKIWLNNYFNDIGGSGLWAVDISDNGSIIVAGGTNTHANGWEDVLLMNINLTTGITNNITSLPDEFTLSQNYPNPFNMSTVISYQLKKDVAVKLDIYDLLGRKIQTLVDENQPAGLYQVTWTADDIASGMYFYKIQAGDYSDSKKMLLAK